MKHSKLILAGALTALAVSQAFGFPVDARVYADASTAVADAMQLKRDRMVELAEMSNDITNTAIAEGNRDLSADERRNLDAYTAEFDGLDEDLKRMESTLARTEMVNKGLGRQVPPAAGGDDEPPVQNVARPNATRAQAAARASVPAQPRDNRADGRWGFANAAQYLQAVTNASKRGSTPDPRLIQNAPTTYGREGVGEDGGFAVPPDFRSTIVQKVTGVDSLLGRTDQMTTSSNSITLPIDETTPWQTSGGIQAYWEREGGQKQQSKPQLGELTVKAHKVIALVPMTDELLEDAPAMAAYVNRKAPEKIDWKVSEAILRGTGVGQPLGILSSPGTIEIGAEGGQAADTVNFANVSKMFYRMNSASRSRGVWLVSPDVEEQLAQMVFPGQGNGNAIPVFLPAGGLSQSPYSTLFGRPIIPTEALPTLGDRGDIVFADLSQYMTLVKGGGVKQDVSIHLFFDYDITAFRFVMRVGGQPWWNTPITAASGTQRGFFVALGARA